MENLVEFRTSEILDLADKLKEPRRRVLINRAGCNLAYPQQNGPCFHGGEEVNSDMEDKPEEMHTHEGLRRVASMPSTGDALAGRLQLVHLPIQEFTCQC